MDIYFSGSSFSFITVLASVREKDVSLRGAARIHIDAKETVPEYFGGDYSMNAVFGNQPSG